MFNVTRPSERGQGVFKTATTVAVPGLRRYWAGYLQLGSQSIGSFHYHHLTDCYAHSELN